MNYHRERFRKLTFRALALRQSEYLRIDVVVFYGVKLDRQAVVICESHKCKWVKVVHNDPGELGMFKCYENPISTGKENRHNEVELCQMADFVVGVGPKLGKAFHKYVPCVCKRHQDVFVFTPGLFDDFSDIQQVPDKGNECSVLVVDMLKILSCMDLTLQQDLLLPCLTLFMCLWERPTENMRRLPSVLLIWAFLQTI